MILMDAVRIVLVRTSHPGNIGAVARAMKTMGLARLYLVEPKRFPDPKATARASGAIDILENAHITSTLEAAIADCQLVIGTSARDRNLEWGQIYPEACVEKIAAESTRGQVALIFGPERTGLKNEELALCHVQATIPTVANFSSLNLAAAVQIFCYELRKLVLQPTTTSVAEESYVSSEETESFYQHLERTLIQLNFLDPENPGRLILRMRRLFNRTRLEKSEINLLRGMLKAIEAQLR